MNLKFEKLVPLDPQECVLIKGLTNKEALTESRRLIESGKTGVIPVTCETYEILCEVLCSDYDPLGVFPDYSEDMLWRYLFFPYQRVEYHPIFARTMPLPYTDKDAHIILEVWYPPDASKETEDWMRSGILEIFDKAIARCDNVSEV